MFNSFASTDLTFRSKPAALQTSFNTSSTVSALQTLPQVGLSSLGPRIDAPGQNQINISSTATKVDTQIQSAQQLKRESSAVLEKAKGGGSGQDTAVASIAVGLLTAVAPVAPAIQIAATATALTMDYLGSRTKPSRNEKNKKSEETSVWDRMATPQEMGTAAAVMSVAGTNADRLAAARMSQWAGRGRAGTRDNIAKVADDLVADCEATGGTLRGNSEAAVRAARIGFNASTEALSKNLLPVKGMLAQQKEAGVVVDSTNLDVAARNPGSIAFKAPGLMVARTA